MATQNSYIIWEGPSAWDSTPLVLLLTVTSSNGKTGNMLQTFILRQDVAPSQAQILGLDSSTCGNCPQRPILAKKSGHSKCYVNTAYSVGQVWRQYNAGKLSYLPNYRLIEGRYMRMGSYGDPAMVPLTVWHGLLAVCSGHTGYTSQWMHDFAQPFQGLLQASCSTSEASLKDQELGWKTYTNLPKGSPAPDYADKCGYSTANDNLVSCLTCRLCDGATANLWVEDHGLKSKVRHY
jgi:hypothetical protein